MNEEGTVLQSLEVAYGDTPEYAGETPTKAPTAKYTYTFAGWDPAIVAVTGDATYTAVFDSTVNKYTIKFVNEDGTILQSSDVAYGDTPEYAGATPTKSATAQYTYTFVGWTPDIAAVTGAATYTAIYSQTVNAYTVTFLDEDGKTVLGTVSADYGTAWSDIEKPADPTKTGYTFNGWSGAPETIIGNVSVTADYTINSYSVVFEMNGHGTAPEKQVVNYGGTVSVPAAPSADGWAFSGWYTDAACTKAYDFTSPVSSDMVLYAKWLAVHSVSFVLNGHGSSIGALAVTDGEAAVKPEDPSDVGWTFVNWYSDEDLTEEYDFSSPVTADLTLYAKWVISTYTVTFMEDDGKTVLYTTTAEHGTPWSDVEKPEDPEKAGHTFNGWSGTPETVTDDVTVTASYTINTYTVTYDANGGSGAPASQTKTYGTDLILSAKVPTLSGYIFQGWATSPEATTTEYEAGSSYTNNESVTLYAVWRIVPPLTITSHPKSVTGAVGETAVFTVTAEGEGLKYQWQYKGGKSWNNCTSATTGYNTDTLQVNITAARNGYYYRCIVTDAAGNSATTNYAILTVSDGISIDPVTIITHPASVTGALGETAVFTVTAEGEGLKYQWQYKGGKSWNNCTSATTGYNTDTLQVNITTARNGYYYRCIVTDVAGNKATSNTATLKVG